MVDIHNPNTFTRVLGVWKKNITDKYMNDLILHSGVGSYYKYFRIDHILKIRNKFVIFFIDYAN